VLMDSVFSAFALTLRTNHRVDAHEGQPRRRIHRNATSPIKARSTVTQID
jgi:hypothetical protein